MTDVGDSTFSIRALSDIEPYNTQKICCSLFGKGLSPARQARGEHLITCHRFEANLHLQITQTHLVYQEQYKTINHKSLQEHKPWICERGTTGSISTEM